MTPPIQSQGYDSYWPIVVDRAARSPSSRRYTSNMRLHVPHGLLALVGNPNLPDGLELVTASRAPPRAA
jgi:hypothetical protein